jgi:beta-glucosidase
MLREYFLPTFEAGIKAGSPTVMINSAEVDGIPGHANYQYLTTILRGEMGFKGFTVSDWEDIKRLYTRDRLAATPKEAVKIAVMAGVDMSMTPFDFSFYELLLELVRTGEVPQHRIDEAVKRILTVKFQAGLFAPHVSEPQNYQIDVAAPESVEVNRQAARESIVLAKNDHQLLPLKKDQDILVIGPTANLVSALNGGWTITWQGDAEHLYPKETPTILQAMQRTSTGQVYYVGESSFDGPIDLEKMSTLAEKSDVILLCLGEKPYTETLGNIESLNLAQNQIDLANAVIATGKPVVLLMIGGRPRVITPIAEKTSAVVLGFLPGMEGAQAIADILYGNYNPDAKLPFSYPRNTNAIVPYDHKSMEEFESNHYEPLYPFGHGLSYTHFETSHLRIEKSTIHAQEDVMISVQVKNTGTLLGKETVLLYVSDLAASVTRPNKQLKAFKKVSLMPGQSQLIHFTLTPHDLSFIGIDLKRLFEPGEFRVMVGEETATFHLLP